MPLLTERADLFHPNKNNFDFNLQFEQLFFSIIPSSLFIVTSLWWIVRQVGRPTELTAPTFRLVKLSAIAAYSSLEVVLLSLALAGFWHVSTMFLAASILKLISSVFMIMLSLIDHNKSLRPSMLLSGYLLFTILLDAAQTRTLLLLSNKRTEHIYGSVFSAASALKVVILLLEAQIKSTWVVCDVKEHSPEEGSSLFSLSVFFWLKSLLLDGRRKVLSIHDLYPLDSALKAQRLHQNFAEKMDHRKLKGDKFGLVKVLVRMLRAHLLLPVLPRLALLAFTFCQPLFIERLLRELSGPGVDAKRGYGFIGASVLIYLGIAISTALYWYSHHRMRTMARAILVTEIFERTTKAYTSSDDDSASLTLMSTDIERIDVGFRSLHEVWASIIQAALACWLLYKQLGVIFLVPMGIVLVCFVGLTVLMKFIGNSQRAWMAGVQKRVGLTATVVSHMTSLKLSGFAGAISDFVQKLRVEELAAGSRFRRMAIIAALLGYIPFLIGPPLTFAFARKSLDTTRMFTSLAYLTILTTPLTQIFQVVPQVISGLACLGRIQTFLELDTRHDARKMFRGDAPLSRTAPSENEKVSELKADSSYAIIMDQGRFGWGANKFALETVNIRIPKSTLTLVVGPVGSGKSTFCKALLGEVPVHEARVIININSSRIGFCEQSPFLLNGSIKENIVGFSSLSPKRYTEVVQATALHLDFDTLPEGDETNIGSGGITLSGGQRQRVSLARALYLQSDLLILDDVLSGLDSSTEQQVFRAVFGPDGLLKRRGSTVILCTHSIKHLPIADHIIAFDNGTVTEQGSFATLTNAAGYVQSLRSWDLRAVDALPNPMPPENAESAVETKPLCMDRTAPSSIEPRTDEWRQLGNIKVYQYYLQSMGGLQALCILASAALWGFFTNYPIIWLTYWSGGVSNPSLAHSWAYYAGVYALLQVCCLISLLLLAIAILIVSISKVGARLHYNALRTVIRAPLRFFATTDIGVITNLFSQDLNLIDTELPSAVLNTLTAIFRAIGQAAVLLTASRYLAISYPLLVILLYMVQRFYLRTARQLRLLDLEAKSPLYTHFLDIIKGIATLRASGFVSREVEKNARLLDSSQRPAYLLVMIQQWLVSVLDLVIMVMAVVLTTLAVRLHTSTGFTGASLVTLMSFGENLSDIVIHRTKLETSIGAISRLRALHVSVEPEGNDEETLIPGEQWPQNGVIELKNVSASYDVTDQAGGKQNLALCDISLTTKPGEKVAVCGRTGSGKSSLIALLLKLLDPLPENGENIKIDGLSLHHLERSALRQRLLALPQQAVFLPDGSTFQANLDPYGHATPEECQDALEVVNMWQFVHERGGLVASMSAEMLSAGQRQLLSFARVVLRGRIRMRHLATAASNVKCGILLLDEVSSNLDQETERAMWNVIKTEFRDYTVVAVSHHLEVVMDFDRVVVMDKGSIVEVGNPVQLAEEARSKFQQLVEAGTK